MKMYVNGAKVGQILGINEPMPSATGLIVAIRSETTWNNGWQGELDELKVYNFGISDLDAEYLYAGQACVAPPELDVDGDCEVSLGEVAAIAGAWLEDGFSSDFPHLDPEL